MDQESKVRLKAAMSEWKAKGNKRLAEACAIALEAHQSENKNNQKKAA